MHQRMNRWRLTNRSRNCIGWLTGGITLGTVIFCSPISAAELTNWQFDPATQQLQVTVPAGTRPRYFLLAQPARIVLDLPNTQVGNVASQQRFAGAVREIRVGQFDANSTRIVIELSPDAVLAPAQVELQSADGSATEGAQWVLRPLLADSTVAAQPAPVATGQAAVPPVELPAAPTAAIAPSPAPLPASVPPPVALSSSSATPLPAPALATSLPPLEANAVEIPVEPSASLPPLEPNAIEIPIEPSVSAAVAEPVETAVLPSSSATSTTTTTAPPVVSGTLPPRPAEPLRPPLPAREPILLPPAIDTSSQPQAVQVPQLTQRPAELSPPASVITPTAPPRLQSAAPIELPPALPSTAPANQVTVPPLSPTPARAGSSVEFGQPAAPLMQARRSTLLPAGTILNLRYPRDTPLQVEPGSPRQEVLVLQEAVRDRAGAVVLPAGTQVIGRFEAERGGSRFVAQALTLEEGNVRLNAESAASERDREISNDDLLVHSALGALALTLLGGFSGIGLVGGAAAGAATAFLSTPEPIVIQPNQVIEVRLTEDVAR